VRLPIQSLTETGAGYASAASGHGIGGDPSTQPVGERPPARDRLGGVPPDGGHGEAEESAVGLGQAACWSREEFWIVLSDLHRIHYHALVRLAALYLDDAGEDAVQDAFVRVSLQWDRIRDADKVLVYVRRAVMNNAKSELRHRMTVRRHPPAVPLSAPAGEDVAVGHLGDAAVVLHLRRLPPRQAACVGLRFYLDLSEKETAEVLRISTGSVKQHTSRAMRKLRPVLGVDDD
jgi:RNA polymerase sigma factor (sigma-70 family)